MQDMIDPEIQIQQSGVDLSAAKVFKLEGEGVLDFTNEKRSLPKYVEIPWNDTIRLEPGTYHIAMNEKIILPTGIAGLLVPRSSALICGIVQHSALWDPGYEGRGFFHVEVSKPVTLHKNARFAQMLFYRVGKGADAYKGDYQGEDILNKTRS